MIVGGSHAAPQALGLSQYQQPIQGGELSIPALQWLADYTFQVDPPRARVTRLRKGVGVSAKWIENLRGRFQRVMVTLTYRGDNSDWRSDHMTKYVNCVRNWYARLTGGEPLRYLWVAELQERGVIHYHAVFWLRKGVTLPKADKRGWWAHGMTKTEKAIKPIGYLMSYVSKIESKDIGSFPKGARLFGVGGLGKEGAAIKRWVHWPSYVQCNGAVGDAWKPRKGGGYMNGDTGQILEPEWQPIGLGHLIFHRVRTHERVVGAVGPFSWIRAVPESAGYLH